MPCGKSDPLNVAKNAKTLDIDNFREFPEQLKDLEAYKDKKLSKLIKML